MILRRPSLLLLCIALASCATHTTPAPSISPKMAEVGDVRLINNTPEAEPRIYFSDGITTYKTDYRGWTQSVIDAYAPSLPTTPRIQRLTLSFSIQAIVCSGHYVADCAVSLLVERGDGVRKIYSTPSLNGYPILSALNRALTASANLAATDIELVNYLSQK